MKSLDRYALMPIKTQHSGQRAIVNKYLRNLFLCSKMAKPLTFRQVNMIDWTPAYLALTIKGLNDKMEIPLEIISHRNEFYTGKGKLYWKSPTLSALQVVPTTEVDNVLMKLYKDPLTTANSRDGLYSHVIKEYAGISKGKVVAFLKNQEAYQRHVAVPIPKVIVPVVTKSVNQMWQLDITFLQKFSGYNHQYNSILTCIDHFSKYAWTAALTTKEAKKTALCLKEILDTIGPNSWPLIIQTDNGTEFKGEFDRLLTDRRIKHHWSYAYAPQSQGAIERFNRTLKRKLFGYLSQTGGKDWTNYLQDITTNYNNTRHGTLGAHTPYEIYWGTPGEQKHEKNVAQLKDKNVERYKAAVKSMNQQPDDLEIGNWVRVSKFVWNPTVEEENFAKYTKGAMMKKYYSNWTKEVFQGCWHLKPTRERSEVVSKSKAL